MENKQNEYDKICQIALTNIYTLTKNSKVIGLINFDWSNDEHKFLFEIALIAGDVWGKEVRLKAGGWTRNKIAKAYKKRIDHLFATDETNENVNTVEVLDFMRDASKKIAGDNFTFADIYKEFYTKGPIL